MENLVVKLLETEGERLRAFAIRTQVFVQEQNVPLAEELDADDETATHVIALLGGVPVGTGRVICSDTIAQTTTSTPSEPSASGMGIKRARIGRMAVARAWRRKGIGARILSALEEAARRQGATHAVLHAQTYVRDFYAQAGYVVEGEPFLEVGIEHVQMGKGL